MTGDASLKLCGMSISPRGATLKDEHRAVRRLCLLAPLALVAQPALARDLLVVGTSFPRIFEASGKPGEADGLGAELMRRAAARMGLGLRFEVLPWLRAQAMVEQGQADVLVGPYRTPEREQRFLFSRQAFYADALVFYARRNLATHWVGDFTALAQVPVAIVQGWAYGDEFERARPGLQLLSTALTVETGLLMLKRGRIELLASNERNTAPVIEALGLAQELQIINPPISFQRGHFAYTRNARGEAWRDGIDQVMSQMRATGELRELARQWHIMIPE